MNILVAASLQADCCYEEKYAAAMLSDELKKLGHKVDSFFMPYYRDMLALPEQITAYTLLDVSSADMLITLGYPACFIPHHNKVIYLFERAPRLFEYWNTEYGVLDVPQYSKIRMAVAEAEKRCLSACLRVICGSETLKNDIKGYYNLDVSVAHMPVLAVESKGFNITEPYILVESCLMPEDRLEVVFEAVKEIPYNLALCIPRSGKVYRETLDKQLESYGITHKTYIINGAAGDDIFKKASYFINMRYESRRVSNSMVRALKNKCPIIAASDSVAELELTWDVFAALCKADAKELAGTIQSKGKEIKLYAEHDLPAWEKFLSLAGVI